MDALAAIAEFAIKVLLFLFGLAIMLGGLMKVLDRIRRI